MICSRYVTIFLTLLLLSGSCSIKRDTGADSEGPSTQVQPNLLPSEQEPVREPSEESVAGPENLIRDLADSFRSAVLDRERSLLSEEEREDALSDSSLARIAQLRQWVQEGKKEVDSPQAERHPGQPQLPSRQKKLAASKSKQLQHLSESLDQALRRQESHLLRGSVDSYRHQAAVDWHKDVLGDLARRKGFSADQFVSNELASLDRPALIDLQRRWQAQSDLVAKKAKSLPPDSLSAAQNQIRQKLTSIRSALIDPRQNFADRFYHLARDGLDEGDRRWLSKRWAVRDAEIENRYINKLKAAKIRDPYDIKVHHRLQKISPESIDAGDNVRILSRQRQTGFRPRPGTAFNSIEHVFQQRFTDPIGGTKAEAILQRQWDDLRRDGHVGGQPKGTFRQWLTGQLTDMDLALAQKDLKLAIHVHTVAEKRFPGQWHNRDVDMKAVQDDLKAIEAEQAYRTSNPGTRPIRNSARSQRAIALLQRHARMSAAGLPNDPAGWQALHSSMERYVGRVDLPKAEALDLFHKAKMKGFEFALKELEKDTELYHKERAKFGKGDDANRDTHRTRDLRQAEESLQRRSQLLHSALRKHTINQVPNAKQLLDRLDKITPRPVPASNIATEKAQVDAKQSRYSRQSGKAARPPPTRPFGDPVMAAAKEDFSNTMKKVAENPLKIRRPCPK